MSVDEAKLLRLEQGQVDIWLTRLSGIGDQLLRRYEELMSESEHARWRRFLVQHAQLQHLVARALVRTTLSRYFDVPPQSWQFAANRYGRPHISQPRQFRPVRFNLSHTSGVVVCAVAKARAIGIDVENIRRDTEFADVAPRVFSPVELSSFLQTAPEMQREIFFAYWTLKESYIKARGMGLSLALDGFWFDLTGASPRVHFTERCPDDSERWQFRQYAPTTDHRLAIAVAGVKEPDVRQHWVVPLDADEAAKCGLVEGPCLLHPSPAWVGCTSPAHAGLGRVGFAIDRLHAVSPVTMMNPVVSVAPTRSAFGRPPSPFGGGMKLLQAR